MPTDPTEDRKSHKTCLLVMAGLPKPVNVPTNTGHIESELVQFLWKMKTENYAEETIVRYGRVIQTLAKRGANFREIQSIKDIIAVQKWTDGTKQNASNAVILFLKYNYGIEAKLPEYKNIEKMVFIPTESELDQLISGCKHRLSTFLQTLKETAARYGEALNLKWTDFDTEAKSLAITPEKGSNPRTIKISTRLAIMLNAIPRESPKIFNYENKEVVRKAFQRARKRIAKNLGNPRTLQIHFHTFRHWKATQELRKTNNIWSVMTLLGHKSLSNT